MEVLGFMVVWEVVVKALNRFSVVLAVTIKFVMDVQKVQIVR
jgi:hypothetical protein